jgi:hypothetical protein
MIQLKYNEYILFIDDQYIFYKNVRILNVVLKIQT